MKTIQFDSEQEWLDYRRGKISGSKLGKMFSKRDHKPLTGFYEVIAERIAIPPTDENVMARGQRLEQYAIERFMEETGEKVDMSLVMWERDDNPSIAYSPDGFIDKERAVEVKCLATAKHIEAYVTKKIPSEYNEQVIQGFITNDDLQTLYFILYDPRCPIDMFYHTLERGQYEGEILMYKELEEQALKDMARIEKLFTFDV